MAFRDEGQMSMIRCVRLFIFHISHWELFRGTKRDFLLTLLLLNTTCPVLTSSVDPDQLASEEAN